jgi:hypothetical protein
LVVLALPAVGVALGVWAVKETQRYCAYGPSALSIASLPAIVGGELRGTIHAHPVVVPEGGMELTLTCSNELFRSIDRGRAGHETRTETLFEETHTVPRDAIDVRDHGVAIPVVFAIPAGARQTSMEENVDEVVRDGARFSSFVTWTLRASAPLPGVDYAAEFEVPVFKTSETAAVVEAGDDT